MLSARSARKLTIAPQTPHASGLRLSLCNERAQGLSRSNESTFATTRVSETARMTYACVWHDMHAQHPLLDNGKKVLKKSNYRTTTFSCLNHATKHRRQKRNIQQHTKNNNRRANQGRDAAKIDRWRTRRTQQTTFRKLRQKQGKIEQAHACMQPPPACTHASVIILRRFHNKRQQTTRATQRQLPDNQAVSYLRQTRGINTTNKHTATTTQRHASQPYGGVVVKEDTDPR